MYFGLNKVTKVPMDLMNNILKPYMDIFVTVFIDDILVYSHSKVEYVVHLQVVLQVL